MADGKVCTKCGLWRPWIDYYDDARTSDGKRSWCRYCAIAAAAKVNRANPERHRKRVREYRERTGNRVGKQYTRARGRALTRLAKEYPDRFEQLLSAELAKERADG